DRRKSYLPTFRELNKGELLNCHVPPAHCLSFQVPTGTSLLLHLPDFMDRTSQWVSSPDIPADLLIRIADDVFPLHKAVMVPKCCYIRKAVAAARGGATATVDLDLSALPGAADAFDKVARYCYGANFELSVRNAAALLCAAAFLDMHPTDGGLARRVEEFLAKVGLRTLPGAVAVLRSCEGSSRPPRRSASCSDQLMLSRSGSATRCCSRRGRRPSGGRRSSPPSRRRRSTKVITALRCRRAEPEVLVAAATAYAELLLAEVLAADGHAADHSGMHRALVESVVAVLPFHGRRAPPRRVPLPPPPRRHHHRRIRQDVPRPGAPRGGGARPGHRGRPADRRARRRR
ncbi:hypothetical protein EE612_053189, partial [Oryza sativa]